MTTSVVAVDDKYNFKNTTNLQNQILVHICKTKDADYKTISKETDRDRITILQSLQSLMKRHLVNKEKVEPDKQKSKLIFKPTLEGMAYSIAFLDTAYDNVLKAHSEAVRLTTYYEFVKDISYPIQRNRILQHITRKLVENNLFDDKGEIIASNARRNDIFKESFRSGLLELTTKEDYDVFSKYGIGFDQKDYLIKRIKRTREVLCKHTR